MGKVISRSPIISRAGWDVGTGAHGARPKTEGELGPVRAIRKAVPQKRGRGRPVGTGNPGGPTAKFIMTLSSEDYGDISSLANDRGMTVQQYIRVFVIRAWRASAE